MLVLTYNFHLPSRYPHPTNIFICNRVITRLRIKNCELKQEPCTLSTELQQTYEFHGHGKNIYSAVPEMWGKNCSEFVTSGDTFVLTLNRASALKVEDNE